MKYVWLHDNVVIHNVVWPRCTVHVVESIKFEEFCKLYSRSTTNYSTCRNILLISHRSNIESHFQPLQTNSSVIDSTVGPYW